MDNVIEARGLVKRFGDFTAVNGINFIVRPRECFGFLGPNGAGKTSTVKMIYCHSPVTDGSLKVLGMDVTKEARAIKRRLGVVAQEDNLDPDLTVEQNLLVFSTYFGIPKSEAGERTKELLDFFGLKEKAHTQVDKLSGGMKRRLAIARALINKPDLLILDEPTTGLDPQARHLVWQRLRKLKEQGVTLILTTHYLDEASQLCDRLVIMDRGQILEQGEPKELVARHIGKEVLELGSAVCHDLIPQLAGLTSGHQVVGEALFLYTNDGQALLRKVQELRETNRQYLRPASLEDVFLKLTGRGLHHEGENEVEHAD
ncbi:MAG: ATP-binding cassette domain-containing protein [Clostridia bacterium]|nr:ATP-binding cassette domain-containing protein [Clostridia bacterium]